MHPYPNIKRKSTEHLSSISETEKAYMAGLFDGEGCIIIVHENRTNGYKSYRLQISIAMKESSILEHIVHIFGGTTCLQKTIEMTRWQAASIEAGEILKIILPYLKLKKERALLALTMLDIKRGIKYHPLKKDIMVRISLLNRRRKLCLG